jgi:hypothetical protein
MALFLTVFEGDSPAQARPVVATSDPAIIAVVRRLLMDRLAEAPTSPVLQLQRRPTPRNRRKGHQGETGA